MLVSRIPTMQLQNELSTRNKPFVFIASMPTGAAKKLLIPSTAGLHIVNADQGCESQVVPSNIAQRQRSAARVFKRPPETLG